MSDPIHRGETPIMRLVRTHSFRAIATWLIVYLLASTSLAQPVPQGISKIIDSLVEMTIGASTTTINHDLERAGFDIARQEGVLDWRGLSPVRKVETAYWSAERARAGSGEDFLARLARQLSADHPRLLTNADLRD